MPTRTSPSSDRPGQNTRSFNRSIALGYVLVTDNQKEFVRIEDLTCES
jgi:hypothetical protein